MKGVQKCDVLMCLALTLEAMSSVMSLMRDMGFAAM